MTESGTEAQLATGFEPATHEAWIKLAGQAIEGGEFEKRLVSRTADGLRIEPLYARRAEVSPVLGETAGKPWAVCQRVDHPEPKIAAELTMSDLDGGASALMLVFRGSRSARGFGLSCETAADLEAALAGVDLGMIAVRLDPAPCGPLHAALVAALIERRGLDATALDIDFGLDPIGALMHTGTLAASWDETCRRLADSVRTLRDRGFKGPLLTCDARAVHEAGGSEAQELAAVLAASVAYARALEVGGHLAGEAFGSLSFALAIDADQLLGLAKVRALRRLMGRVQEASSIEPRPIRIHAETAWRMMTKCDPWVNMLRTTMAAATAGLGGADTVTVLPFTSAIGLPDGFARRVARNSQLVLLEESNLWRVADPAAGSGALEALTDGLCKAAWALFQEIEREGGIVASLASGALQRRIAAVREARALDVATRQAPLTGTSEFPMLAESPVAVLDVRADTSRGPPKRSGHSPVLGMAELIAAFRDGATRTDLAPGPDAAIHAEPLPSTRSAEPFELLRDAAKGHSGREEEEARRPRVFLASLGTVADHNQRSTWVQNLLAAGGTEAVMSDGYASPADAAGAFTASGATVACIASSDALYAVHAEETARRLKADGAKYIFVAGRPGEREAALRAAGVDGFLFSGQNVVATLRGLHEMLGVGH